MTAEAINAATLALKTTLIERALGCEMNHHLGYPASAAKPANATNQRNGKGAKTVLTEDGPIGIEAPRERDGSFEPILIPKHEQPFTGFDDTIVAKRGGRASPSPRKDSKADANGAASGSDTATGTGTHLVK